MGSWPSVSVVIPARNEASNIVACLDAVYAQDYEGEVEVLVVDGGSFDETSAIVARFEARRWPLRQLHNPGGVTPVSMNTGIAAARHDLVLRVDGHAIIARDFLRRSVEVMRRTGASNVGGRWEPVGVNRFSRAVARVMRSSLAVGPASWRHAAREMEVDTVPFGLWRREELVAIGMFDPELRRNQDYELNHRLRQRGGRVIFSPSIVAQYRPRDTAGSLWRQYFQYGFWKARVALMHPSSIKARHLAAPGLVLGAAVAGTGALASGGVWAWLLGAGAGLYTLAIAVETVRTRAGALGPAIFVIMHAAWGLGFWLGLFRWLFSGVRRSNGPRP